MEFSADGLCKSKHLEAWNNIMLRETLRHEMKDEVRETSAQEESASWTEQRKWTILSYQLIGAERAFGRWQTGVFKEAGKFWSNLGLDMYGKIFMGAWNEKYFQKWLGLWTLSQLDLNLTPGSSPPVKWSWKTALLCQSFSLIRFKTRKIMVPNSQDICKD